MRVRYKQTVLGAAWAVIRPLLAMAVFTVVFGRLAKMPSEGAPYSVFVLAGLLPWTFFSTAVDGGRRVAGRLAGHDLQGLLPAPARSVVDARRGACRRSRRSRRPRRHGGLVPDCRRPLARSGCRRRCCSCCSPRWPSARCCRRSSSPSATSATSCRSCCSSGSTPRRSSIPASLFPPRWRWLLYLNPMAGPVDGFRAAFLGRPVDPLGLLTLARGLRRAPARRASSTSAASSGGWRTCCDARRPSAARRRARQGVRAGRAAASAPSRSTTRWRAGCRARGARPRGRRAATASGPCATSASRWRAAR